MCFIISTSARFYHQGILIPARTPHITLQYREADGLHIVFKIMSLTYGINNELSCIRGTRVISYETIAEGNHVPEYTNVCANDDSGAFHASFARSSQQMSCNNLFFRRNPVPTEH